MTGFPPFTVVHLNTAIGDGITIDADQVLDEAKGEFVKLVMVGVSPDGEVHVRGTHGAPESVMLLEWAKHFLVQNITVR